jgi:hypothetical protein
LREQGVIIIPGAADAVPRAFSKSMVEAPIVYRFQSGPFVTVEAHAVAPTPAPIAQRKDAVDLTDADWAKIAALHAEDAQLDQGSYALMQEKSPDAATAGRRAMSKMIVESPLIRTMRNFQRSIAEDTVRNEYLFHVQIHRWLADPSQAALVNDVAALNKRVYAELFLTPDSDPWLGLVPADTYTALDDDGVCPNPAAQPK